LVCPPVPRADQPNHPARRAIWRKNPPPARRRVSTRKPPLGPCRLGQDQPTRRNSLPATPVAAQPRAANPPAATLPRPCGAMAGPSQRRVVQEPAPGVNSDKTIISPAFPQRPSTVHRFLPLLSPARAQQAPLDPDQRIGNDRRSTTGTSGPTSLPRREQHRAEQRPAEAQHSQRRAWATISGNKPAIPRHRRRWIRQPAPADSSTPAAPAPVGLTPPRGATSPEQPPERAAGQGTAAGTFDHETRPAKLVNGPATPTPGPGRQRNPKNRLVSQNLTYFRGHGCVPLGLRRSRW